MQIIQKNVKKTNDWHGFAIAALNHSALFRIINVKNGANSKVFNIEMIRIRIACFYFASAMKQRASDE